MGMSQLKTSLSVINLMRLRTWVLLVLFVTVAVPLSARVALLVEQPFGKFAFFTPTGHAAIYLSRVCAETPTRLRLCEAGETGVVISRYNRIGGFDWVAMPPLPYFYAVDRVDAVPRSVNADVVDRLKDGYRRAHLTMLAPDGPEGEAPKGDWVQLLGVAYDRSVHAFAFETKLEDDERLVRLLNSQQNQRKFNLFYRNCADFARGIINFYYPGMLRRNYIADVGISTPKNLGRVLVKYFEHRPHLGFWHFLVPQIPGLPTSKNARGVSESLVRSKKYVVPLLLIEPWAAAVAGVAYLTYGRFDPAKLPHTICEPHSLTAHMTTGKPEAHPASESVAGLIEADTSAGR